MDTRKLLARDFCHRFCLNEAVQIWVSPQGMLKTRFNPWNQKIYQRTEGEADDSLSLPNTLIQKIYSFILMFSQ